MRTNGFKIFCLILAASLALTGCKKWLDAPAPMQVDQKDLFSSEQGFKDVLNGVYLQMGSRSLYGRDLSFGLLSVLGRSYDTTISPAIGSLYYQGARYNFQDPEVSATQKNIWDSMYLSIANLNNLLANIDSRQNIFTANNYNTVKGEAIALRAFLHFELLRMFAPSPAQSGLSAPAIPYVTKLSPYAISYSSTGEVLDNCIADLLLAKTMLSDGDVTTSHFTSWAVKGLLARAYMYKGDLTNAQSAAMEIINSGKFPLATSNSDLLFTKEHLFSLWSYTINSIANYKTVLNTTPPLGFTATNQTALFVTGGGATSDWRRAFVDPASGVALGNTISPRKFYGNNANILPIIRVTEMYYIAAECANSNADSLKATTLLDSVRAHRNVPVYTTAALKMDSVNIEIRKEYQKEFVGEGQMFYYYKRKNLPFASLPFTKTPVIQGASYIFIKPE